MTDVHSAEQRSFNMSRIRSAHTKPEILVRSLLHRMGCRFRLHSKALPGKPDIVMPARNRIVFVHGCFWHMHRCRYGRVTPATNTEFWQKKRSGNVERDRRNLKELRKLGWHVLIVWECWTRDPDRLLIPVLDEFLRDRDLPAEQDVLKVFGDEVDA